MLQASQQQSFARIITTVAELKATDLHMTIGTPPIVRVDGELKMLEHEEVVTPEVVQALADGLLTDAQKQQLEAHKDITVSQTFMDRIRFRMNVFYQKGALSISMRFIPDRIPPIDSLGLPHEVQDFSKLERGLILITGPFGSGKTTTAASLVQKINIERAEHIVTAEDPIEYLFSNAKSVIEQREVGRDATSLNAVLDLADREDVDVVVVSGLKTPDVISKTIELSMNDRLVIGTLAAESIPHALQTIVSSYPADQRKNAQSMISEALQGIICQQLIKRIGGGLVLVPELFIPDAPARSVIRDGNFSKLINITQTSREHGMISRDMVLAQYVQQGVIAMQDARAYAHDPDQLQTVIQRF